MACPILSRVSVTPRERRKYYAEHLGQYMTYPRVRYAGFKGRNKTHADSLAARLKAGEKAEEILKADPSAGAIREMAQNDRTAPGGVKKALFEEFRPGEVRIIGPDDHGQYVVAQLISFDAGRQLPFDEVQQYVDESIQNLKAERRLQAFLERHKRGCRIEAHPELVMQIRLIDPAAAPPG